MSKVTDYPIYVSPSEIAHIWSHGTYTAAYVADDPRSDEALGAIRAAGFWSGFKVTEKPTLTNEDWAKVGRGQLDCPICNDSGSEQVRLKMIESGYQIRTSRLCNCSRARVYYGTWDKLCPPLFRDRPMDLRTLAPSDKSCLPVETQKKYIDIIRENPRDNYLLAGPSGAGKTHFLTCLLSVACADKAIYWTTGNKNKPSGGVYRMKVSKLVDEAMNHKRRSDAGDKTPPPTLSEKVIRDCAKLGWPVRVYLDEMDKLSLNEARENYLFEIFDTILEVQGQLVITSNLSPDQLASRFRPENQDAFMRRIKGDDGRGHILDMFKL
jgi:hypothetical protein